MQLSDSLSICGSHNCQFFRLTHRPVFNFPFLLFLFLANQLQFHLRISMHLILNFKRTHNPYTCIEAVVEVERSRKALQPLDANRWQTGFDILQKFHLYSAFILFLLLQQRKLRNSSAEKKSVSRFLFWKWKKTEVFLYQSQYMFFVVIFVQSILDTQSIALFVFFPFFVQFWNIFNKKNHKWQYPINKGVILKLMKQRNERLKNNKGKKMECESAEESTIFAVSFQWKKKKKIETVTNVKRYDESMVSMLNIDCGFFRLYFFFFVFRFSFFVHKEHKSLKFMDH